MSLKLINDGANPNHIEVDDVFDKTQVWVLIRFVGLGY